MPMPLDGIKVIDWTIWQQGPVASAMLADLGAEVIKIEDRVSGDPGRGILQMSGLDISDRPNFYFEANNRNKKSITLDLKRPEAREVVYKLVAREDRGLYSYQEVSGNMREAVFREKFTEVLDRFIKTARSRSEIEIREDVLAALQLSGKQDTESDTKVGGHGH